MKKAFLLLFTLGMISSCNIQKPTEIIVVGAIHNPQPNFNPEILLELLEGVQPDLILRELDSAAFTEDFNYKEKPKSNEGLASLKYQELHPATLIRPYEFEGRNEYRINIGSRPTDGLTTDLLDSLASASLLTEPELEIYNRYNELLEPLKLAASSSPENFNN